MLQQLLQELQLLQLRRARVLLGAASDFVSSCKHVMKADSMQVKHVGLIYAFLPLELTTACQTVEVLQAPRLTRSQPMTSARVSLLCSLGANAHSLQYFLIASVFFWFISFASSFRKKH
jgi:hypothetical protein